MTVRFDKNIYDPRAVAAAAREFAGLAVFGVKTAGKETRVEIKSAKGGADESEIRDEFANYILFLMNK